MHTGFLDYNSALKRTKHPQYTIHVDRSIVNPRKIGISKQIIHTICIERTGYKIYYNRIGIIFANNGCHLLRKILSKTTEHRSNRCITE
ncbi:hypothetical protein D3C73_1121880 [compost metagenome]